MKQSSSKRPRLDSIITTRRNPLSNNRTTDALGPTLEEDKSDPTEEMQSGTYVWAKVKGYPWWPALVSIRSTNNKIR